MKSVFNSILIISFSESWLRNARRRFESVGYKVISWPLTNDEREKNRKKLDIDTRESVRDAQIIITDPSLVADKENEELLITLSHFEESTPIVTWDGY